MTSALAGPPVICTTQLAPWRSLPLPSPAPVLRPLFTSLFLPPSNNLVSNVSWARITAQKVTRQARNTPSFAIFRLTGSRGLLDRAYVATRRKLHCALRARMSKRQRLDIRTSTCWSSVWPHCSSIPCVEATTKLVPLHNLHTQQSLELLHIGAKCLYYLLCLVHLLLIKSHKTLTSKIHVLLYIPKHSVFTPCSQSINVYIDHHLIKRHSKVKLKKAHSQCIPETSYITLVHSLVGSFKQET